MLSLLLWLSLSATAGEPPRLLFVGDSHVVGEFGKTLDAMIRAAKPAAAVETYGSCGSKPSWYLPGNPQSAHPTVCGYFFHHYLGTGTSDLVVEKGKDGPTPLFSEILRPGTDVVVFNLGSNLIDWVHVADPSRRIADASLARTLAQRAREAGAQCVWLGPADKLGPVKLKVPRELAKLAVNDLDRELKRQTQGLCAYVESEVVYEGTDGLHYSPEAGKKWAGQIFLKLGKLLP